MRALFLCTLLSSLACSPSVRTDTGAPAVNASESPKKEEPKRALAQKTAPMELKEGGFTYTEKVILARWENSQKEFLNPHKDVWAFRQDTKDGLMFGLRATVITDTPTKGSVITDKDGNEYTITDCQASSACFVKLTKKAEPKP